MDNYDHLRQYPYIWENIGTPGTPDRGTVARLLAEELEWSRGAVETLEAALKRWEDVERHSHYDGRDLLREGIVANINYQMVLNSELLNLWQKEVRDAKIDDRCS